MSRSSTVEGSVGRTLLTQPTPTLTPSPEPTPWDINHNVKMVFVEMGEISYAQKVLNDRLITFEGPMGINPDSQPVAT